MKFGKLLKVGSGGQSGLFTSVAQYACGLLGGFPALHCTQTAQTASA